MSCLDNQFERISSHDHINFYQKELRMDKNSPIGLLINGIIDNNIFSTFFQNFPSIKHKLIRIFEGLYFLILNTDINYFHKVMHKKLEIFHVEIFSIFLRRSLTAKEIKKFKNIKKDIFYLYYESKDNQIKQDKKVSKAIYFQKTSTFPSKFLYGFERFSDLILFYSELVKNGSNWPVYALFPLKSIQNPKSAIQQKVKLSKKNFPYFSPILSLFYVSFAEKEIQNPARLKNVKELYSVKQINDVQISHLTSQKSSEIRTFFGFIEKFRCFHVFDFLTKSKMFNDARIINIQENHLLNIKYDLFYLEVQSEIDFSACFSINYVDSFSDNFSTFFAFDNFSDFVLSKSFLNSQLNKNRYFAIKNIKTFDADEFEILFARHSIPNLKFVMFRVKRNEEEKNFKNELNVSLLLKSPVMIKKDLTCSLDGKKYIVAAFDNIENREKSISILKKSAFFMPFKCYFPENLSNYNLLCYKEKIHKNEKKRESSESLIKNGSNQAKRNNDIFECHYSNADSSNSASINNDEKVGNNQSIDIDVQAACAQKSKEVSEEVSIFAPNSINNTQGENNNFIKSKEKNRNVSKRNSNISRFRYRITDNSNEKTNECNVIVNDQNANKVYGRSEKGSSSQNANNVINAKNKNYSRDNYNSNSTNNYTNSNNQTNDSYNNQINNISSNQINDSSSNQINNIFNNQINDNSNKQINDSSNKQINDSSNNQINDSSSNQINNSSSNQINDSSSNQINNIFNNQINDNSNKQINDNSNNQINDNSNNQMNNSSSNQINDSSNNQINDSSNNQINDNSNNQMNNSSNNQINDNSNNQINDSSNNQINDNSNNQMNNSSNNQINDSSNNQDNDNSNSKINDNLNIENYIDNKNTGNIKRKNKTSRHKTNIDVIKSDESHDESNEQKKTEDTNTNSKNTKPQIVDINDYNIIKEIGRGSYGNVQLIEDKKTHKKYASKSRLNNSRSKEDFKQEIEFYSHYKLPFFLKLFGYTNDLTMILEYMPNGSLADLLKSQKKPEIKAILDKRKYIILHGIVQGMILLHDIGIIHRDLKPDNILLDENYYPRISDFGTALIFRDEQKRKKQEKSIAGTLMYLAPEIYIEEKPYTNKVDVYSFAIIAYELLTGEEAFPNMNKINKRKFIQKIQSGLRPDVSKIKDQSIKIFIQRCWSPDPTERPTFKEIDLILSKDNMRAAFLLDIEEYMKYKYWIDDNMIETMSIKDKFPKESLQLHEAYKLFNGIGVPKDEKKSLKMFKELADKDYPDACMMMGNILFQLDNPSNLVQAAFYFKKAADLGYTDAMVMYGNCKLEGLGTNIDYSEAVRYYEKAVDLGNQSAMFNYAKMLEDGKGIKADINKALEYYKIAADLGDINAMYQFARINERGELIPPNYELAVKYYRKAAYYGDEEATSNLGILLSSGKVEMNLKESINYLKIAAQSGKPEHIFNYAQSLAQFGLTGNCTDDDMLDYVKKAKKQYKKAAELGHSQSKKLYDMIKYMLDNRNDNLTKLKENLLNGFHKITFINMFPMFGINEIPQNIPNVDSDLMNMFLRFFNCVPNENKSEKVTENMSKGKTYIPQIKPNQKAIEKVSVNIYQSIEVNKGNKGMALFLSPNNLPKKVFNAFEKKINFYKGVIKEMNFCTHDDPNRFYNFYFFPSLDTLVSSFSSLLDIIKSNKIDRYFPVSSVASVYEKILPILNDRRVGPFEKIMYVMQILKNNRIPVSLPSSLFNDDEEDESHSEYLYFDESMFPSDTLTPLFDYLKVVKEINDIKRNVFDGKEILTYIFVKKDKENEVVQLIRDFLSSSSDILFEKHNYPIQNAIMFNEKMILKDKNDFDVIYNEIISKGFKPINVERNKIYSYDFYPNRKLFQTFSFICFQNEIEKMKALNHINSIVYKNRKNILHYNTNLTYARIDEICIPIHVRKTLPDLFQYFKGVEEIQRNVLSIENPVVKTYIGFDSSKHMKKCYYKFVYRLNFKQFNPEAKLFCKKKGLNYMFVLRGSDSYEYILKRVSRLADDIQEDCQEALTIEKKNKKSIIYTVTYIGFDTKEKLQNAIQRFENDPNVDEKEFDIYHEGKGNINITNDPKESYMFYNSL